MIVKKNIKRSYRNRFSIFRGILLSIFLLFFSFLNYCILQIDVPLYIPINTIIIFGILLLGHNIPVSILFFIGIIDDFMMNGYAGLFASLYIAISYIMSLRYQQNHHQTTTAYRNSSIYPLVIACVLYIIINIAILVNI